MALSAKPFDGHIDTCNVYMLFPAEVDANMQSSTSLHVGHALLQQLSAIIEKLLLLSNAVLQQHGCIDLSAVR